MMLDPIAIVGAGAWGTALANAAAETGRGVMLWGRDPAAIVDIATRRENGRFLPGVALHSRVRPTSSLQEIAAARLILLVVPAQAVREIAEALALIVPPRTPVIVCAKGIERATGLFMTDVVGDAMPSAVPAILSGPSFADDVARGLPTAVTLACMDEAIAQVLARTLSTSTLRVYHTSDVRGVEIGGAAKNVLAIAAGIVAGRGLGESARAALIARGFAELSRFARAYGAKPETLHGLSGLGDLILTCGSEKSRNYAFGLRLGRGDGAEGGKLAEGAFTASILMDLARARGIDMPICAAVDDVLTGAVTVNEAIEALMARPVRAETE